WIAFLLVLVFLCVDDWTINVLNLYSGGLSLSNMFERLGRFWTTLIASVVGVALCGAPGVLNFFRYVTLFGNVFSPVACVHSLPLHWSCDACGSTSRRSTTLQAATATGLASIRSRLPGRRSAF